jgi:type IV secretory pathway VirB2 component (pilin)
MIGPRFGTNFTVFVIFFGMSMIEGLHARNWALAAFWLGIGAVFLAADNLKQAR